MRKINLLRCIAALVLTAFAFVSGSTAAEKMSKSDFNELLKKVEAGDADAQFELGMMCYNGKNVKQD